MDVGGRNVKTRRTKEREAWIAGLKKAGFKEPSNEARIAWGTGYNMGYAIGLRRGKEGKPQKKVE